MQVVDVRTTVVGAPWRDLTFVELVTDSGLTGVGEVRMVNKTETLVACIRELAGRYVIGTDPFEVERLTWNIQWAEYGRAGEVAQSTLSAFEVACWDLMGQHLGVPVWTLLGGRFNDRIPAYANGWYQGDREPSVFSELARGVTASGYRALKVDPFGGATIELSDKDLRHALSLVEAVREAIGPDRELMIEMHGRFAPDVAARVAVAVEPYHPAWIEEPVSPDNTPGLRRVRAATHLPIATGERLHSLGEFRPALRRRPGRCRPGRPHALRRLREHEAPGGLGVRLPAAVGAAQRVRTGRHDGEPAPGGLHAELSDPRALQRLRGPMGVPTGRSATADRRRWVLQHPRPPGLGRHARP